MLIALSTSCMVAYADDGISYHYVELTQEKLGSNPSKAIETVLNEAKNNANYLNRYIISVPSGEYDMTSCLHIYSYTSLISQPDTIYNRRFSGNLIKCGKQGEESVGYDGYTDIYIDGGVWNGNFYSDSCAMRFGHCRNLNITNLSINDVYNNHHIEIAAAENALIDSCHFSGYKRNSNTSQEAVQLDILHSDEHFPSYTRYDDTPCRNITVSNCIFQNVFSGVGTRSGVIGSYFDNINIVNNTFTNITNKAITCFNYTNSKITDNLIEGATMGVFCEYYPTKNLTSVMFKPNDSFAVPIIINACNTEISRNTINVVKKSSYDTSCGIGVYGGKLSASSAKKYKLVSGDYTVKNLKVADNIIHIKSAKAHGINLKYVKDSVVKNNYTKYTVKRDKSYYNINLNNSTLNMKSYDSAFSYMAAGKVYKLYNISTAPKVTTSKHTAVLKWKKVGNATGYKIYRADKKNGEYQLIKTIKGANKLNYTDKKVKKRRTYYYKIVPYKSAKNSTIYGKFSSVKKIKIK